MTGVLAAMLALLFGTLGNAIGAEKTATPGSPAVEKRIDKASPELMMTGKVVKAGGNSFTIEAKGKQHTFVANNFKTLPKVGAIVDVTYSATPGGPLQATSVRGSKSNTSE